MGACVSSSNKVTQVPESEEKNGTEAEEKPQPILDSDGHIHDTSGLVYREATNFNTNLLTAAKRGDLTEVRFLLVQGCDVNIKGMWNSTPLIISVQYGFSEVAATLLLTNGIDVGHLNEKGAGALLFACMNGDTELVKAMLSLGADASPPVVQSIYNQKLDKNISCTPLSASCINGEVAVVELLLLAGCDINMKFPFNLTKSIFVGPCSSSDSNRGQPTGLTPLSLACYFGNTSLVEYLVSKGADASIVDSEGLSPLHQLVRGKSDQLMDVFLKLKEGNLLSENYVNCVDDRKCSALHYAVDGKFVEISKELLNLGSNPNIVNSEGVTALHIAVKRKCEELVILLLSFDADPLIEDLKQLSSVGYAAKYCRESTIFSCLEEAAISWRARRTAAGEAPYGETSEIVTPSGEVVTAQVVDELTSNSNQHQEALMIDSEISGEPSQIAEHGVSLSSCTNAGSSVVSSANKNGTTAKQIEKEPSSASMVPRKPSQPSSGTNNNGTKSSRVLVTSKHPLVQSKAASANSSNSGNNNNNSSPATSSPIRSAETTVAASGKTAPVNRRASASTASGRASSNNAFVTPEKRKPRATILNPAAGRALDPTLATPSAINPSLNSPTPLELQDLC